jgi:hypothetical protein
MLQISEGFERGLKHRKKEITLLLIYSSLSVASFILIISCKNFEIGEAFPTASRVLSVNQVAIM